MSSYSDYIKQTKTNNKNFFFGEGNYKMTSNKYYTFKRVLDADNIIVATNNIKILKGNYVLLVDNNKGVYLKDWQVRKVRNFFQGIDTYLVKLSRKYFKPYTFSFEFEDFAFDNEVTFDELFETAKLQEEENLKFADN